jgi:hypothetical protein
VIFLYSTASSLAQGLSVQSVPGFLSARARPLQLTTRHLIPYGTQCKNYSVMLPRPHPSLLNVLYLVCAHFHKIGSAWTSHSVLLQLPLSYSFLLVLPVTGKVNSSNNFHFDTSTYACYSCCFHIPRTELHQMQGISMILNINADLELPIYT